MAQTTRRIAAVSTGTLMLCLWSGGSALAATSTGTDGSTLGTLSGTTSTLLSPTPTPTPSPLGVVSDTVATVTKTAGVPNPLASPTPTTTTAPLPTSGGKTGGGKTSLPSTPSGGGNVMGAHTSRVPSTTPYSGPMTAMHFGANAFGTLPAGGSAPTVAPQTAVLAAGVAPALAPAPHGLLGGTSDDRTPRGLFIALATMVIGALAAGHVKVIQDRAADRYYSRLYS